MSEALPPSDGPPWEDPRRVLRRHGLRPKRGMSQNFLVARSVVERIADAVAPRTGEIVVELGPGLGTLTTALLRRGAVVVAVEKDPDMIGVLEVDLATHPHLHVQPGDATSVDLESLLSHAPGPVKVAGNLPYSVTGAILRNLVRQRPLVARAVVMVQREVGDRLLAGPGTKAYGALTVFTSAAFSVARVLAVPKGAFHPAPKVSSAVLSLTPSDPPRARETPAFSEVVRAAFQTRRKTLRNALVRLAAGDSERVARILKSADIDGGRRGETLSVEEFDALAKAWVRTPK